MKISWNWLRQLVQLPSGLFPPDAVHEVARRLIKSGVAVDAVTAVGVGVSGVIVAEVRGKRPHPKADKLTLVDVFDGQTVTQVVCGAPNVPNPGEPGQSARVAWARPGAKLPSGLELSVREVRGVPSPGMLCAEDELGLSTDHAGIILLRPEDGLDVGSDFATGAGIPDWVLELDITPNRPDLLGHLGVAREVAAAFAQEGARLVPPTLATLTDPARGVPDAATTAAAIDIHDAAGCARYVGHVLRGLRVGPSPLRDRLLLSRLGARPINNLVDATNLAMFLTGQPLHAFDLGGLSGRKIIVRRAHTGEPIKTLDSVARTLSDHDLVIADEAQPVAVAGVMGGENSEVRSATTDVLLEAAYFDPVRVRSTARALKIHSEASHRFERGVDPNDGLMLAARVCADHMLQTGGGQILAGSIDVYPRPIAPRQISLRTARTSQILGIDVPLADQVRALTTLGLTVGVGNGTLAVTVPTFRPDLTREIDLIEEIGRIVGYDDIRARVPQLHMAGPTCEVTRATQRHHIERARDLCTSLGFDEIMLFSMTGPDKLRLLSELSGPAVLPEPLRIENPLREELSVLRTLLLPGLLEALRKNLHHGQSDVRLCEVGEVFLPPRTGTVADPQAIQQTRVAGVLCGHRPYFLKPAASDLLDFADVRGIVEELLDGLGYVVSPTGGHDAEAHAAGREVVIRAAGSGDAPWLHPGLGAVILSTLQRDADDHAQVLGFFGEVHPSLRERLDIATPTFCFELDIPRQERPAREYHEPPRFPTSSRDLSFLIATDILFDRIADALHAAKEPLLRGLRVLEDYRHPSHVPAGQKGVLLSLTYRADDHTLTDDEAQAAHDRVVAKLAATFPIKLR